MNALERFNDLAKQKAKEEEENRVLAAAKRVQRDNQEKEIWKAFTKSYQEFNKQTLLGKKLEFKSEKKRVSLFVNGELYLEFFPKW